MFFSHFPHHHKIHFPEKFIEIFQVCQKIWIFISLILTILVIFFFFFFFFKIKLQKKKNDVSISEIISAINIRIYINIVLVLLPIWWFGESCWPTQIKLVSKSPALEPWSWNINKTQSLPEEPIIVYMFGFFKVL